MNQINAITLQNMFLGGAKRIEANKEYINELNVFRFRMEIREQTCQ